jgi:perosamine synthetase
MMWIRKRLDISTRDLLYAVYSCLTVSTRKSTTRKIEQIWEKDGQQSLICLSVRTGFDLLFQALNLEPGSEILMSALTIPDMPRILAHHRLVPVPIDIDIETLAPSAERIEVAITTKTKAIVIAHLFGGISDLKPITDLAKKYNLLVIEDCAQAYYSSSFSGSLTADVSMFSFGTIKTATALGGGILIFRNSNLPLVKMHELHQAYQNQSRRKFVMKVLKYFLLILVSSPKIFPLIIKYLEKKGIDYDAYIHKLSRSFPNGNFYEQIRKKPCLPLLKLMLRRFKTYDFSRINKRIERGNFLVNNLPESILFPGIHSMHQTFWAFPILTAKPQELILAFRTVGFDATHKSSLKIIESTGKNLVSTVHTAQRILSQAIFLPLYPEMPLEEFKRIVECINDCEHERSK